MKENLETPEQAGRRKFLIAGLLGATIGGRTHDVLAQVSGKLNNKPTGELLKFLDGIDEIGKKTIPDGTKTPDERYFIVIPDKTNAAYGDIKIYKGTSKNKKITIIGNDGAKLFPKAESVSGSGLGERILLNDDAYIMVGIGVPVNSESLPENERSEFPYTYTVSTPPNKAFQTPEVQQKGLNFLRKRIRDVFQGAIKDEDISSQMSEEKIEDELDQRLILLFAMVEHMDIALLEHANDTKRLSTEYSRVLTNYALNRNLAYRYGKSKGAEARGIMQITPETYRLFSEKYEDVDLGEDLNECVNSTTLSIKLASLLLDESIDRLIRTKGSGISLESYRSWRTTKGTDPTLPIMLGILYNGGTSFQKKIQYYLQHPEKLPIETQIYIKKILYVWSILFGNKVPSKSNEYPDDVGKKIPKIERKKSTIGEGEIRSTLRGRGVRLRFEKERAKETGKRARTFANVREQIQAGRLLKIRATQYIDIDGKIGVEGQADKDEKDLLHYLTPIAKANLERLAELFFKKFGKKVKVNSMNRTEEYVKKLRRVNPNATSPSSHEYGTSVDISHKNMSPTERKFVEQTLLEWQLKGYIIAIKEHKSACYHIFSEKKVS